MLPKFIFQDIEKEQESQTSNHVKGVKLKLREPILSEQGVSLTPGTQKILLASFSMLILGKPGSGKSHFINELIDQQNFYKYKFDRIIYIGPTRYPSCIHDQYNTCSTFDIKFIQKKIQQCQGWATNILIIFDDVISQIPTQHRNRIQQLFFNRRHQLKNGTISMITTSQKLTSIPTWLRSTINCLVTFSIPKVQIKNLFNQIPLISNTYEVKKEFENLQKHHFLYFNLQLGKAFDYQFNQI